MAFELGRKMLILRGQSIEDDLQLSGEVLFLFPYILDIAYSIDFETALWMRAILLKW